jgi:hypothetical protein
MEKPFHYLTIPFSVSDKWRDLVTDFDKKQYIRLGAEQIEGYLNSESLEIFKSLGLKVGFGNVWSWLEMKDPAYWHIDQQNGIGPIVAFNYLLQGDPGETQWAEFSDLREVVQMVDPEYRTPDPRYSGYKVKPA